jgi:23S rRNA (pseudouridine1915-N3)-methyltransferase
MKRNRLIFADFQQKSVFISLNPCHPCAIFNIGTSNGLSNNNIPMNIKLIAIGKTDNKNLQSLIDEYQKRLSFYIKFDLEIIPDIKNVKNLSESQQKEKEGELILAKITPTDQLILLDENGKTYSSVAFSEELQKKMNSGVKTLVFVIGGPYGFSETVYAKAQGKISLSLMTFSHQMVRLFFIEQLYRGFTILKNEPYHHQ